MYFVFFSVYKKQNSREEILRIYLIKPTVQGLQKMRRDKVSF